VVAALRSYGLTLQNFASIKEQQIGGFIQVQKSIKDSSSYCKTLINPNEP
jgi:hypothetical protein